MLRLIASSWPEAIGIAAERAEVWHDTHAYAVEHGHDWGGGSYVVYDRPGFERACREARRGTGTRIIRVLRITALEPKGVQPRRTP